MDKKKILIIVGVVAVVGIGLYMWNKSNKTAKEVDPRTNWHKFAKIYISKSTNKIDVIVSTSPTLEAHKIASDIKKRNPKAYWAADFRDLPYKFNSRKKRIVKIEKELIFTIKNAESIFTVSKMHSKILNKLTRKKIFEIKNGFDKNYKKVKKKTSPKKKFSQNLIRIVHTGMIYPIYRDPTPILKTFALLSKEGFFMSESTEKCFVVLFLSKGFKIKLFLGLTDSVDGKISKL
jgi:hypothetical protein